MFLDEALTEMEHAKSMRLTAEDRAGTVWRDVVYRELERRQLDPLEAEESRYLSAARGLDAVLDRCMARLRT